VKAGLVPRDGSGVCVGDYDNDGWEDLYVTYYGRTVAYHNDHGVFAEVAEKAVLRDQERPGYRLCFR